VLAKTDELSGGLVKYARPPVPTPKRYRRRYQLKKCPGFKQPAFERTPDRIGLVEDNGWPIINGL
jgi:hypothetical protein